MIVKSLIFNYIKAPGTFTVFKLEGDVDVCDSWSILKTLWCCCALIRTCDMNVTKHIYRV